MKLENIRSQAVLRGILADAVVSVVSVQWYGSEALELTYKTPSGKVANELLYRHDGIVNCSRGCYRASPSRRTARSLSGCTGRALLGKSAPNASICSADSATGSVMTIQETPSVQGGVVSEPG